MKVSDCIVEFIKEKGIVDVFLLPGGGMMHLLDSLAKHTSISKYSNLNEQATTVAAEGYAIYTNHPGVAFLTTGPGATNAITGVADAYIDSLPLFVISGQVKTADLMTGKNVRQIGAQECNIVELVSSITKYSVTVTDPCSIKYHLEKAWHSATTDRRGPVWLDIPLDVQSAEVDWEQLQGYRPPIVDSAVSSADINDIFHLLNISKKPLILFGNGIASANAIAQFRTLVDQLAIPVMSSWRAKDVIGEEYDLYFDSPGSLAPRYSNFILQNCDLLLVLGARLNFAVTAFNEKGFAPTAKKIVVDIDPHELALLQATYQKKIQSDAGIFIHAMLENIHQYLKPDYSEWISYCISTKNKYPLAHETQPIPQQYVDGYKFGLRLQEHITPEDVVVSSSSGRASAIAPMTIGGQKGNRFILSTGLGSMGFALPISIGACIASGKKRTICIEGDGSLQHNLQELQLIKTYALPIKLFILNNGGYASIYGMQRNHFSSRFLDCTPESGLTLPSLEKIAALYSIAYFRIEAQQELDTVLSKAFAGQSACLCDVLIDINFEEIPRTATKLDENGKPYSTPLDDLYPFLQP